MADEKIERKLAVIFATDVVGFSTAMETNENETLKSLRACKEILNKLFEEHSGRIFNTAGDSVLAEFQSAVSAVVCASEFQKFISNRNASVTNEQRMEFRIGVNMGDVIVEGNTALGISGDKFTKDFDLFNQLFFVGSHLGVKRNATRQEQRKGCDPHYYPDKHSFDWQLFHNQHV